MVKWWPSIRTGSENTFNMNTILISFRMKHPPLCSKRLQVSITMNREDYKIMAILAFITSIPILITTSQFSGTGKAITLMTIIKVRV